MKPLKTCQSEARRLANAIDVPLDSELNSGGILASKVTTSDGVALVEPVLVGVENELEQARQVSDRGFYLNIKRQTLPPVGWYGLGVLVLFAVAQVLSSKPG